MTSRNLFFKLMKEDLKRRLWAIGFSVLALFFAMPMAAAMGIGGYRKPVQTMADLRNRIRKYGAGGTASDENPAAFR